jgi:hypothetical protein
MKGSTAKRSGGGYLRVPWELVDGRVGGFMPELVEEWRRLGTGSPCPLCDTPLEEDWLGPSCPGCIRARRAALGCLCEGSNLCPDCRAAGGPDAKCSPDCSTLCPVCNPDD